MSIGTNKAAHEFTSDGRPGRGTHLVVDRASIEQFAYTVFGYCEGFVAERLFSEKGNTRKRSRFRWHPVDKELGERLAEAAERADAGALACYVIPGVVAQRDQASARHIVAMQTICADLDTGDIAAKLRHLKRYAGEPSMVVASGGLTDKRQEKVHVYWKLTEPAVDTDVERVCRLRGELIHRVGADPSFRSAHQPIRVAGSLYRKGGTTKLVEIREINHREYDLSELAE